MLIKKVQYNNSFGGCFSFYGVKKRRTRQRLRYAFSTVSVYEDKIVNALSFSNEFSSIRNMNFESFVFPDPEKGLGHFNHDRINLDGVDMQVWKVSPQQGGIGPSAQANHEGAIRIRGQHCPQGGNPYVFGRNGSGIRKRNNAFIGGIRLPKRRYRLSLLSMTRILSYSDCLSKRISALIVIAAEKRENNKKYNDSNLHSGACLLSDGNPYLHAPNIEKIS
jgi:hypothetical protein